MSAITNPAQTIARKRDGEELTDAEISSFIMGLGTNAVADYQASAFLMAVYLNGMTLDETVSLTRAMLNSGIRHDLSSIPGVKVDKHSTGGVGDKVSIILAPLAAACGLKVPMMAGRGLGHSGGTIDKLESISGFLVKLTPDRFKQILSEVGCAIIGQSEQIAPADRKLYALRDVTATVESNPLIVASILSKKLAEGTDALVMDVKVGSGAFMKTKEDAKRLARDLIKVAGKMGLPCRALLTNMNQPLGCTGGNALEIAECIDLLRPAQGKRADQGCSADLKELTIQLCAHMLELGKITKTLASGRKLAHAKLVDGSAWKKFEEMVEAQGGSVDQIRHPEKLPKAPHTTTWKSPRRGYITGMNTEAIGNILVDLGAGRHRAADPIDAAVGLVFHKKLGAHVEKNDDLVTVHYSNSELLRDLEQRYLAALTIGGARKTVPQLILDQL
ncbi:MAG: thymidine phosphorylase [Oligoflexia bacterium]|nr:thymidine phosphorylase [Oligoflexia bacterium]